MFRKTNIRLANRDAVRTDRLALTRVEIGSTVRIMFIPIIPDLNRDLILGMSWLENSGAAINFKSGKVTIRKPGVHIHDDIPDSVLKLKQDHDRSVK